MADPVVDATVSGASANSYLDLTTANALMNEYPTRTKWGVLTGAEKSVLLFEAARRIDRYQQWGPPMVPAQRRAFPRAVDPAGVIPDRVLRAATAYLDMAVQGDLTPLKKLQGEGVTSMALLGGSQSFEREESGLPAEARHELDILFYSPVPANPVNLDCPPKGTSEGVF